MCTTFTDHISIQSKEYLQDICQQSLVELLYCINKIRYMTKYWKIHLRTFVACHTCDMPRKCDMSQLTGMDGLIFTDFTIYRAAVDAQNPGGLGLIPAGFAQSFEYILLAG